MPTATENQVILYHLGYRFPRDKAFAQSQFHHVRVVLLCGTISRAKKLAQCFGNDACQYDYSRTDRFTVLLPVPSVLIATHGIGLGSIDCLLNDLHHLLTISTVSNFCYLRIGSSGGLGISPGTIVVTRNALNGCLKPEMSLAVLGSTTYLPAKLDISLSQKLFTFLEEQSSFQCVMGDTLCAETFFDTQARTDGANPLFSSDQADAFLKHCHKVGVKNIEMESLPLATFATRTRVPAAVVCATFVDRLVNQTPTEHAAKLAEYENNVVIGVTEFVKKTFVTAAELNEHASTQKHDIGKLIDE